MPIDLSSLYSTKDVLALSTMKLAHLGQSMIGQQIDAIQKLIESCGKGENNTKKRLIESVELLQMNIGKMSVEKSLLEINAWLESTSKIENSNIQAARKGIVEFKIYLELIKSFKDVLTVEYEKEDELECAFENALKRVVQQHEVSIKENRILLNTLNGLLKCKNRLVLLKKAEVTSENELKDLPWKQAIYIDKLYKPASHPVMSKTWLMSVLGKDNFYFNSDFTISESGFKRLKQLFNGAFNNENETINQNDLALIGVLFGRTLVRKNMRRYALKGEGTEDAPFSKNNLKALLLGMTANHTCDEMEKFHPLAKEIIDRAKRELITNDTESLLTKEFEKEKQNKPSRLRHKQMAKKIYDTMEILAGGLRRFLQNRLIATINVTENEWLKKNGSEYLSKINPPNLALTHLLEDINLLKVKTNVDNYLLKKPPLEKVEKKIKSLFESLEKPMLTFRGFCLENEEFSIDSLNMKEKQCLKGYHALYMKVEREQLYKAKKDLESLEKQVNDIFYSKIKSENGVVADHVVEYVIDGLKKTINLKGFFEEYTVFQKSKGTLRGIGLGDDGLSINSLSEEEKECIENYHKLYIQIEKNKTFQVLETLEKLKEQVKDVFYSKINPLDMIVDGVVAELKILDFERFVEKYNAFKKGNCTEAEYYELKKCSENIKNGLQGEKRKGLSQAKKLIMNKFTAIYPYARATLFSQLLAYSSGVYSKGKENIPFYLPLEHGQGADFALKPIIHDEHGLAVSLFSPQTNALNNDDTIPLYLTLKGTNDILSGIRDLHPQGAGCEEFNLAHPFLNRILTAVNHEIQILKEKYPKKKVSIEIFGHSLGGADSYQLLLALQEAMSQNKERTSSGKEDYNYLCNPESAGGFFKAKNPLLRETLSDALKESLGMKEREFVDGRSENRTIKQENINAVNLDNIANIKVYTKSSAGCHNKVLSALAATAAFLGRHSHYVLYDNPLDIHGDAVQRTGHGRGLHLVNPREHFFRNKVKVNHCKINGNKGGLANQLSHALAAQIAPLEAHQELVFDQGPLSWLQQNTKITENDTPRNADKISKELANPVVINGKPVVDIWAYRKLKASMYATLSLTAALVTPTLNYTTKMLTVMGELKNQVKGLFGITNSSVEPESKDVKACREALLTEQRNCLFSFNSKANELPTELLCHETRSKKRLPRTS